MAIEDPKEDLPASLPAAIAPLTPERLAERSQIKRMEKRAHRLSKPAYVSTDAAYQDKRAGVAYVSAALGDRTAVIASAGSAEAEYLAMLMAMYDADSCLAFWPAIVFRTDCATSSTATPTATRPRFRTVRTRMIYLIRGADPSSKASSETRSTPDTTYGDATTKALVRRSSALAINGFGAPSLPTPRSCPESCSTWWRNARRRTPTP